MKVLLLHEMSGVHTHLKQGLKEIGISAEIATLGDGWKNYSTDIFIGTSSRSILSHLERIAYQLALAYRLRDFDVVQIISPNPFHRLLNPVLQRLLFQGKTKAIYIAAGSDAIYRKHVKELDYYPPHNWDEKHNFKELFDLLMGMSAIVPVCWEYEFCMRMAGFNTEPIIPFAIETRRFKARKLGRSKKIRVFHPLNRSNLRYDFKGTKIVQEAFSTLQNKYHDIAEFFCEGGLSHQRYNECVDSVDILVDQVYSQTYGMSAALAIANGKVVLSGLTDRSRQGHYEHCPIINIEPSVQSVVNAIEPLLLDKKHLIDLGCRSREFAVKYHEAKDVAMQYADIYSRIVSP